MPLLVDLLALAAAGGIGAVVSAGVLPAPGSRSPLQRWRHARRWRRRSLVLEPVAGPDAR